MSNIDKSNIKIDKTNRVNDNKLSFEVRLRNFINKSHILKSDIKLSFQNKNKNKLYDTLTMFKDVLDELNFKALSSSFLYINETIKEMDKDYFPDDITENCFLEVIDLVESECNDFMAKNVPDSNKFNQKKVTTKQAVNPLLQSIQSNSNNSPQMKKRRNEDFLSHLKGVLIDDLYESKTNGASSLSKELSKLKHKYSSPMSKVGIDTKRRKSVMVNQYNSTQIKEEEEEFPFKQEKFECNIY